MDVPAANGGSATPSDGVRPDESATSLPHPDDAPADLGPAPLPLPSWKLVFFLALPVLAQQSLHLVVRLSDGYLAGNIVGLPLIEEAEVPAAAQMAALHLAAPGPGEGMLGRLGGSLAVVETVRPILSQKAAFQAAHTNADYLGWFIVSYSLFVSIGSTALVARFTGAGHRREAVAATHQSLLLALAFGVAASAVGLLGGLRFVLGWMKLEGLALDLALDYLQPLFWLLPFQIVETAGIACLVGAGDTRTGLGVMIGVALANIPLSWAFTLGLGPFPHMGFAGIAMGTALSHLLGALTVLLVLSRGRFGLRLSLEQFRPRWDLWRRLLRVGLPAGFDSLSVTVGQFWFLSLVNRLGEFAASAHGIAIRWEALGYLSGAAFGTAAMTLVGQNLGAGRPDQARRAGWMALSLGAGFMTVMGLVFYLLAVPMFALFCPSPAQEPIIRLGVPVLRLVAFAMPALACCIILASALRGAGDTRVPVLFTWAGFFGVRIPLTYWLTQEIWHLPWGSLPGGAFGLFGAWIAMVADLVIRGSFFLARFLRGAWVHQRV